MLKCHIQQANCRTDTTRKYNYITDTYGYIKHPRRWMPLVRCIQLVTGTTYCHTDSSDVILNAFTNPKQLKRLLSVHPCFQMWENNPTMLSNSKPLYYIQRHWLIETEFFSILTFLQHEIRYSKTLPEPRDLRLKNEFAAASIACHLFELFCMKRVRYKLPSLFRRMDQILWKYGRPYSLDLLSFPISDMMSVLLEKKQLKNMLTFSSPIHYKNDCINTIRELNDSIRLGILLYHYGIMTLHCLVSMYGTPTRIEEYQWNASIIFKSFKLINAVLLFSEEDWATPYDYFPCQELLVMQLWLIGEAITTYYINVSSKNHSNERLAPHLLSEISFNDGVPVILDV